MGLLWMGAIGATLVAMSQITPPIGSNLCTVSQIGKAPCESMIIPYAMLLALMMCRIAYWERLATWLPRTMDYNR